MDQIVVGLTPKEDYGGRAVHSVVDRHTNDRVFWSYSFSFRKQQLAEEASPEDTNGRYEVQEVGQWAIYTWHSN